MWNGNAGSISCWVPRTEEVPPERADDSHLVASGQGVNRVPEETVEQQVPTAEKVVPDGLTVIKGIGPAVQLAWDQDLRGSANPDDLANHLKGWQPVPKARVHSWIKAARQRTEARD